VRVCGFSGALWAGISQQGIKPLLPRARCGASGGGTNPKAASAATRSALGMEARRAETLLRLRALARQPARAPSRGNAHSRQHQQPALLLHDARWFGCVVVLGNGAIRLFHNRYFVPVPVTGRTIRPVDRLRSHEHRALLFEVVNGAEVVGQDEATRLDVAWMALRPFHAGAVEGGGKSSGPRRRRQGRKEKCHGARLVRSSPQAGCSALTVTALTLPWPGQGSGRIASQRAWARKRQG
jgi:hypothetical protein